MWPLFLKIFNFVKNICFPLTCACCENFVEDEGVCPSCWQQIRWMPDHLCKICGKPIDNEDKICCDCIKVHPIFDKAIAVFAYDNFSKKMIFRFKNEDSTYLAPLFAKWIYGKIFDFIDEIDVIVPVPISYWRRIFRKYNQTELLAKELHKSSHINYNPHILKKIHATEHQKGLTRTQRWRNLRKSFAVSDDSNLQGKNVLLIDDVITTGATANECAKKLKEAGAEKVFVATIARVDLDRIR
ncbi:MAG: ComF family protein [Alphaproteobacteria bacterium]|nr:ComF family protein [Alphaproteobacteria bacterium]